MHIKTMEVGSLCTNSYLVYCDDSKEGVIIDPGGDGDKIIQVIKDSGVEIKYILNTHGHHNHIGANKNLKDFTGKDLLIHEKDGEMLTSPKRNFSLFLGEENCGPAADGFLKDGDVISFGSCSLKVIHLPGHTPGGVGFYAEKEGVLFSGDTLFYGSIGRTDLPGSDYQEMTKSLEKLMKMPDETIVYPGHGPKTSVALEKEINPFI
jgi:glyoxylase-like metal-dependent hydrolase (beta-lactamase superfamily II)